METKLTLLRHTKTFIWVIFSLTLLINMKTCSQNSKNRARFEQLSARDSTLKTYQLEIIKLQHRKTIQDQIDLLELAKNIVYDQNSIVRKKTRPDDVIKSYDLEIKSLKSKLDKLNK